MEELHLLQKVAIWILPVLFAITAHEAAHGWVASQLGDQTAKRLGRVTLNPIKHIDLVGTIILPLTLLLFTGFILGWAKPVPVDWRNLRQPRRDVALVSIAGPGSNLLMAIFWAFVVKIGWLLTPTFDSAIFLIYTGQAGILINCILMILNLLPILPLDGGRVLHSILPPQLASSFGKIEPYGIFILLLLLISGLLGEILFPLIQFTYHQMVWLAGLS